MRQKKTYWIQKLDKHENRQLINLYRKTDDFSLVRNSNASDNKLSIGTLFMKGNDRRRSKGFFFLKRNRQPDTQSRQSQNSKCSRNDSKEFPRGPASTRSKT